jgi:hypothetical protein
MVKGIFGHKYFKLCEIKLFTFSVHIANNNKVANHSPKTFRVSSFFWSKNLQLENGKSVAGKPKN